MDYNTQTNFGGIGFTQGLESGSQGVLVHSIDGLCFGDGSTDALLPMPDFIKIDVEGMECAVLNGGRKVIAQKRPVIFAENDRVERSSALIALLWELGYELYWHITPLFNPQNFFANSVNEWPGIVSFNMLCIPKTGNWEVSGLEKITDKDAHPLKR